ILRKFKKAFPDSKVIVSGGNDAFHHNLSYVSRHTKGEALDFVIEEKTEEEHEKFIELLDRVVAGNPGFSYIDEYKSPSRSSTGGHFHVSYRPNKPEIKMNKKVKNPIRIKGLADSSVSYNPKETTSL